MPSQAAAHPVLILHSHAGDENLSSTSLIRIYAMQKRVWSDNTPIKVFTLPNDSESHKEFVNEYLRMQPYQLDRLWNRLVFSGTGSKPEEVSSPQEMIEKVRETPGAIGYIDSSLLDSIDKTRITVVSHE